MTAMGYFLVIFFGFYELVKNLSNQGRRHVKTNHQLPFFVGHPLFRQNCFFRENPFECLTLFRIRVIGNFNSI